jgi:hypothetical protein
MWIANAAFGILPWNAPGTDDIVGAVHRVWPDATVYLPWNDLSADWPATTAAIPRDAFLIRAEGAWRATSGPAPAALPMKGFDEPIHVAEVWERVGVQPSPVPPPSKPGASPAPSAPATPGVPPSSPVTPPPGDAPRRGLSSGAKLAIGGGAVLGIALVIARSRASAAGRRRVPA